jgi:hypothetical protein
MTITEYDAAFGNLISGYPSATVDRGVDVDPSAMSSQFFQRLQVAPKATLVNGALWDETTRTLNVSVTANFTASANSNYKLACVLTEAELQEQVQVTTNLIPTLAVEMGLWVDLKLNQILYQQLKWFTTMLLEQLHQVLLDTLIVSLQALMLVKVIL